MRVPGAAAGLVVFLGLSGGVFGIDCEVPKGHTDPEIISPVGHEPTAGYVRVHEQYGQNALGSS